MMRLIDADSLITTFQNSCAGDCTNCRLFSDDFKCGLIDEEPTVDPVKHAHWIISNRVGWLAKCSNCHKINRSFDINSVDNYCSRCGYKMDEEAVNSEID